MRPLLIQSIPQSQDLALWTQVEKRLKELSDQKKRREIEARDRVANKILFFAECHKRSGDWAALWNLLLERGAIAIGQEPIRQAVPRHRHPSKPTVEHKSGQLSMARDLFRKSLPLILTCKWQTVPAIALKFQALHPDISKEQLYDRWLLSYLKQGLCFQYSELGDKMVYYANCEALDFDDCWLPKCQAYKVALQNGYDLSAEHFGDQGYIYKTPEERIDFYAQFGLEYRDEIPKGEPRICRWKIKDRNI